GRLRRPRHRAAPVQPERPRAVAAHQRGGSRGHRLDRRPEGSRVRARHRRRGPPARDRRVIAMDLTGRPPRLRAGLADAGCDALLVTSLTNIRWLTGVRGSAARVVVLPDELVLVTDGRYGDQAQVEMDAAGVDGRVLVGRSLAAQMDLLADTVSSVRRLGLEAGHVSWAA